jgi:hypothetical protein
MKNCKICNKPAELGEHATGQEKATGLCMECLNKAFSITSICRIDLLNHFTAKQVAKFDDGLMERLAGKMSDAYCDNGFWTDSEIIGEYLLED